MINNCGADLLLFQPLVIIPLSVVGGSELNQQGLFGKDPLNRQPQGWTNVPLNSIRSSTGRQVSSDIYVYPNNRYACPRMNFDVHYSENTHE